jgi:ribosomal protein S18 acetylase RimI-like enzyme
VFDNKSPYVPVDLNKYKKLIIDEKVISLYKNKIKPLKHIRANINTKGYLFLNSEDEFVGLINIEKKNDGIWIQALEANSNMQNSGIGTQLLKIATNELSTIKLSVRKNNIKAIKLYRNNNWEEYAQTENMIFMKYNKLSNNELNSLLNKDFWSL